jgi:hypothetical protein
MPLTRAAIVTIVMLLVRVAHMSAADLRVTDTTNTAVTVREAYIDYGGFSGDKESEGVRVLQGDAVVTAKWANIQTLIITGKDSSLPESRLKAEVVLKNGSKMSVLLVNKGRMRLAGITDLGDYSIDLEKVRTISPAS